MVGIAGEERSVGEGGKGVLSDEWWEEMLRFISSGLRRTLAECIVYFLDVETSIIKCKSYLSHAESGWAS